MSLLAITTVENEIFPLLLSWIRFYGFLGSFMKYTFFVIGDGIRLNDDLSHEFRNLLSLNFIDDYFIQNKIS